VLIQEALKKQQLTQQQLAEKVGTTKSYISRNKKFLETEYPRGNPRPNVPPSRMICRAGFSTVGKNAKALATGSQEGTQTISCPTCHSRADAKENKSYHFGNFFLYICVKPFKVKIFSRGTLRDFWSTHGNCELQLKTWYREIEKSNWTSINELKNEYPSASILKENRIVFTIKGNEYRLIVKFNFEHQLAGIRFIGTYAEFDKINANEI
jgi:mRNA interferase HigB